MPYYTEGPLGANANLLDLPASTGDAASAAFDEAIAGNPSFVGWDLYQFKKANSGQKLTDADAAARIKSAGVNLVVPQGGLTSGALDILIERKRDEIARQTVLGRAPTGFLPSTARVASSIGGALLDPLNIAVAFVPVVGEARYAELLYTAGSAIGRLGVRVGVGAVEGAVGAALVEPINYYGRTQLQDDYGMTDSLMNLAFGAGMGAGLHGAAGAVGDALGVSHFARGQQQRALDAATERLRTEGAPIPEAPAVTTIPQEFRQPIELATKAADAPFPKRWDMTAESAQARALAELSPDIRAQLIESAGNRLEGGAVPVLRKEIAKLEERLTTLDTEAEFKSRAKAAQQQGASRKEAEAIARKDIAAEKKDVEAARQRAEQQVEANTKASQAQQDLAKLDAGQVPDAFRERIEARASQMVQAVEIEKAMRQSAPPAEFVIGMADQVQREAAMRASIAHAFSGRIPAVESLFGKAEDVAAAARVVADQQARPESIAVADFKSSAVASEKLKAVPADRVAAAEQALDAQQQRLDGLLKNLEQRGFSPEKIERMRAELKPFDEAIADTDNLAKALEAAAVCGLRG